MPTKPKIKIQDCPQLRQQLEQLSEQTSQLILAQWSLKLAAHILERIGFDYQNNAVIQRAFAANQAWQQGNARVHDVRQAGFQVHRLAKSCEDTVVQSALRVAGQAVGTGHMREHAMVASDYAVKVMNLKYPGDMGVVAEEREWQILNLKKLSEG
jgi:hypothetical protein